MRSALVGTALVGRRPHADNFGPHRAER